MPPQLDLFGDSALTAWPAGLRYQPELITPAVEQTLLAQIRGLPFKEFDFHGYTGKRRTVSYGWSYDFSTESLQPTEPMPPFLADLRIRAAAFAERSTEDLSQVLITEYGEGAAIGWHRDKAVFGEVIGISLASGCSFRFRRAVGATWERVTINAEPRSAYLLTGPARTEWEHSIPPVETLRYSVTFRTLAKASW
jgi:alkylated DNA repair dioxygenase AlkB